MQENNALANRILVLDRYEVSAIGPEAFRRRLAIPARYHGGDTRDLMELIPTGFTNEDLKDPDPGIYQQP